MARIRTIKPEFWQDEDLSLISYEARLMAIGLLNHADDEGYFKAHPALVKAACFPFDEDSTIVRRTLEQLENAGYLYLFDGSDGKKYGHIISFSKHQRVDRSKPSQIKPLQDSTNDRRMIDDESTQEGKGKEGKGREGISPNGDKSPKDGDLPKKKNCPHQEIQNAYHEILPMCPRVRDWTSERQGYLRARWNDDESRQDVEWWKNYFTYVSKSPFLTGKTEGKNGQPPFIADLEWLVRPSNFVKIIEGKYHRGQRL